jgi:Domain of unknown function (DUF4365)
LSGTGIDYGSLLLKKLMTQTQSEGLDLNSRKEALSYAYIDCITTTAGYVCEVKGRGMDNAGVDLTIEVPGEISSCLSPRLDAQIKCTSRDCIKGDFIHFDLPVKNYVRLIHTRAITPQLLIVTLVHQDVQEWIKISTEDRISTIVNASAYWISLKGREPTENKTTVRIEIPLSHRLSPEVLKEIMRKIAEGEEL